MQDSSNGSIIVTGLASFQAFSSMFKPSTPEIHRNPMTLMAQNPRLKPCGTMQTSLSSAWESLATVYILVAVGQWVTF